MNLIRRGVLRLFLPALLLCLGAARAAAADKLTWHRQQDKVDADIRTWDVKELLQNVAVDTGWHVFLDPGAIRPVSAKFKGLPSNEALKALLSGLNYLLIPQTNGMTELYVFRTSRGQATTIVAPVRKAAQPIPNELVVTLKPGSKTKIDDLAKSLGAKVIGRMDAQSTYLLQFDDQAAADAARTQLASNPDVASVDVNYPVDAPPTPDSLQASGPDLKLNPQTNTGPCQLVVGLIDTPVEPLPANMSQFLEPAISVAGSNQIPSTQLTHGTAMAETILDALQPTTGGNSSVKILPVDVYGNSETTTTFDVANGIVQAVNNGANILNLSLGSTGNSQLLQSVINQVLQQGIPIYAAAGNQPVTTPTYPAAYPGVVAVTASDPAGGIAPYANRGSFVQIIAPGDNVVPFDGESYMVEGTSTATAIISGTAAGLADSAHDCADQANALLQKAANTSNVIKH
jgi:Subtilase family